MNQLEHFEQLSVNNIAGLLSVAGDWAFLTDLNHMIRFCHKSPGAKGSVLPENLTDRPFAVFLPQNCCGDVLSFLNKASYFFEEFRSMVYEDEFGDGYLLRLYTAAATDSPPYNRIVISKLPGRGEMISFSSAHGRKDEAAEAEAQLSFQISQQELLTELSGAFSGIGDPYDAVRNALRSLGEFMRVDRCAVFRHDHETMTYSCLFEWHSDKVASSKPFLQNIPYNESDEGYIQLTSNPYLAVEDTFGFRGEAYQAQREAGVRAFVGVPIMAKEQFWGFLGVDSAHLPRVWTVNELNLLQTVSGIFAANVEKQLMQNELDNTAIKLQEIVKSYPGIIWTTDTELRVTLIEGRGAALVGDLSMIGRRVYDLNENLLLSIVHSLEDTLSRGPQSFFVELDGVYLSCKTTPLTDANGQATGLMGVALDVTYMRNMQIKLQGALEEAEKANRAKSEFLSRMSHEIRTPMNAIIGMHAIASKSGDMTKVRYCLDRINSASQQLLDIVNDILDMSKIEANMFEIVPNEFCLEKMLQNVLNIVNVKAEEKRQEIRVNLKDVFSKKIICDELRLSQVMTNLLSNAVKFTPEEGEIILQVRQLQRDGTHLLHVEVCDNGIGISQEQQQHLFQSFEQADSSITRQYGGTGLGLAICKRIVNMMGGDIRVESAKGKGSIFSFEVGFEWGGEMEHQPSIQSLIGRDLRVLVVDDSVTVQEYFRNVLQGFYLYCDTAFDGDTAIAMVSDGLQKKRPYNIVFIDWQMPGKNGVETARMIKEIAGEDLVIILISSADWSEMEEEAERAGISQFLPKPVLPSAIFNAVVEALKFPIMKDVPAKTEEKHDWSDKTLLVAEDIEINREIMISILADTGIAIDCAENGLEALSLFSQQPERYDLILMDVQMPELDGLEVTRQIRALSHPAAQRVPIVAMTASAFKEDILACLAAGMNNHVAKPIDLHDIMTKLALYLS